MEPRTPRPNRSRPPRAGPLRRRAEGTGRAGLEAERRGASTVIGPPVPDVASDHRNSAIDDRHLKPRTQLPRRDRLGRGLDNASLGLQTRVEASALALRPVISQGLRRPRQRRDQVLSQGVERNDQAIGECVVPRRGSSNTSEREPSSSTPEACRSSRWNRPLASGDGTFPEGASKKVRARPRPPLESSSRRRVFAAAGRLNPENGTARAARDRTASPRTWLRQPGR